MFPSLTISLVIDRPCAEIYNFLANAQNLSRWTEGVFQAPLEQVDEHSWTTLYDGRMVTLEFTPPNAFGVLDLNVSGRGANDRFYRARVFPNGEGTELCCTILQRSDETDEHFQSEFEWLRTDLMVLKSFFEAG